MVIRMDYFKFECCKKKIAMRKEIEQLVAEYSHIEADNVMHIIQCSEHEYVIFIDSKYDLDWVVQDNVKKCNNSDMQKILVEIGILQNKPAVNQMNKKMKLQFNCLLGTALAAVLENASDSVGGVLDEARQYLSDREYEITRGWIVYYSLAIFIGIWGMFGLLQIIEQIREAYLQYEEVNVLVFGMTGSVLSILQHNGKLNYTCSAGRKLVFLQIVSKVMISMISAFLISKAFEAEIIFVGFSSEDGLEAFKIILYIVAGFSERMVPSLIEKIENSEVKKDE